VAIPSVLVNAHLFVGKEGDTMATAGKGKRPAL
jgi:hypothetical protein